MIQIFFIENDSTIKSIKEKMSGLISLPKKSTNLHKVSDIEKKIANAIMEAVSQCIGDDNVQVNVNFQEVEINDEN